MIFNVKTLTYNNDLQSTFSSANLAHRRNHSNTQYTIQHKQYTAGTGLNLAKN